ncbi:hypothetical protein GCM10027431_09720 [Lysobacter rhizosphaerae]
MIDLINPIATLIASFGGAWAAFKLQSVDKARDVRRTNIVAANRALLTMMQQANTLKLIQIEQIDPHRESRGRHFSIRATLPHELDTFRFDFKSLDFLDGPHEQQLLFELSVEERRFIETLRAINARSELLLTEVDPKLNAAGFLDGGSYSGDELMGALGQPLCSKLKRLTDDVVFHVDKTNESIIGLKGKFRSLAKARYPSAKFVDFDFPVSAPVL